MIKLFSILCFHLNKFVTCQFQFENIYVQKIIKSN